MNGSLDATGMKMRILGINDDVTVCECCGKTGLKCTVVLEPENGGQVHFGRQCAAMAVRGDKKSKTVNAIESEGRAITLAKKWLSLGRAAEIVRKGIWTRFGYPCEIKGNELLISDFLPIKLS